MRWLWCFNSARITSRSKLSTRCARVPSKRGRSLLSTLVYGPKGSIKIIDAFEADTNNFPSPIVFFEEQQGVPAKVEVAVQDVRGADLRAYEFREQASNFLRCLRGEEAAVNSSSQAIQLMEMLDAIYRSSQLGKEVTL